MTEGGQEIRVYGSNTITKIPIASFGSVTLLAEKYA